MENMIFNESVGRLNGQVIDWGEGREDEVVVETVAIHSFMEVSEWTLALNKDPE